VLDLAVVCLTPEPPVDGVLEMPLLDDRIDALLPINHKLAGAPAVTLQELRNEPWVDCSGMPVRHHFGALGIEPNIVFVSDHHRVVEGMVAAGVAVALLPRLAQPVARRDVLIKAIAPRPPVRPVGIAVRAGDRRPAALATMLELLEGVVAARDRRRQVTLTAV